MAVVGEIVRWQGRRREEEKERTVVSTEQAGSDLSSLFTFTSVPRGHFISENTNNTDTLGAEVTLVFLVSPFCPGCQVAQ